MKLAAVVTMTARLSKSWRLSKQNLGVAGKDYRIGGRGEMVSLEW